MHNEQLHRDLGRVEGSLTALTTQVSGIEAKLDAALAHIEQQKGARRATVYISSAVSSVVAFAVGLAVSFWGPK